MSATLAVATAIDPVRVTPGSEKVVKKRGKAKACHLKAYPPYPPFAWAVPPSPAPDKHACLCAFADLPLDSVDTVAIGPKGDQFYCAFLCTIVQLEVCTSD